MKYNDYLKLFRPVEKYSLGTATVMADRQIKRGIENGTVHISSMGSGIHYRHCVLF